MKDRYHTIGAPSEGIFKQKGSKFLAFAYPVGTEEEIRERLAELRKTYHDARHHCYAWRLGPELKHFRSYDDGEPAGSAGNPILGQIRSKNLTNVLVVVVRYFGGTLLGVGGLIHAYRSATSDALERSSIVERKVYSSWEVRFSYPAMNSVMKLVKELDLEIENQFFETSCSMSLRVWIRLEETMKKRISLIEDCTIEKGDNGKL
jgi:uncharacterized YigZ family protein